MGLYLGFTTGVLSIIESKSQLLPLGSPAFFCELLTQWLKWAPPDHPFPTVRNLVSALKMAGEERMGFQLEEVFLCRTRTVGGGH